jgi:hypothetical protein
LRRLMAYVRDTHETAYFTRSRESRSSRTRSSQDAPSSRDRSRHRKRPMLPRGSVIWGSSTGPRVGRA